MLSTAGIGRVVASAIRGSAQAEFVAVAGRNAGKAATHAAELGVARSFGSYDELLACDGIDAVYVPLPIALHTEWTVRALQAGKPCCARSRSPRPPPAPPRASTRPRPPAGSASRA
jgi:predicted dehydrogenase